MKTCAILLFGLLGLWLPGSANAAGESDYVQVSPERVLSQTDIPVYSYKVIHTYPHDKTSYTEGLTMVDGSIYEGTGLYGHSKLLQWELPTGHVVHAVNLDPQYFGEGVTVLNGRIYQLTYLSNTGFVYDQKTFQRIGEFHYAAQGWGLTTDGKRLIIGNGSSGIQFLDPKTFAVERQIFVGDNAGPVGFLNELEYADGKLYANVWQTYFIAVIAPETGKVIGWIDLTGLNPDPSVLVYPDVLNGIAYDAKTGHLLVTGKRWPSVWEIELVPRQAKSP